MDLGMQKQLDHEVRDMIKSLNSRLSDIRNVQDRRFGSSQRNDTNDDTDEDDNGVRIITLAGSNIGCTMKRDSDGQKPGQHGMEPDEESEGLGTYVNSNFQAVNNSIMMSSSYDCHDPGVHVDVSDIEEGEKQDNRWEKREEGFQHKAPASVSNE